MALALNVPNPSNAYHSYFCSVEIHNLSPPKCVVFGTTCMVELWVVMCPGELDNKHVATHSMDGHPHLGGEDQVLGEEVQEEELQGGQEVLR